MNNKKLSTKVTHRPKLTANEKAFYKKLIVAKLEALNIKDDVMLVTVGKKQIQFKDAKGQTHSVHKPVNQLRNMQRNLVKRLLDLGEREIRAFLESDFGKTQSESVER